MKNKWLAGGLNLLPGLGYLYIGTRIQFAILLLLACPVLTVVAYVADPTFAKAMAALPWTIWDTIGLVLVEAAFVIDGYFEAKQFNRRSESKK